MVKNELVKARRLTPGTASLESQVKVIPTFSLASSLPPLSSLERPHYGPDSLKLSILLDLIPVSWDYILLSCSSSPTSTCLPWEHFCKLSA